jgi:hypothetical protein
MMSFTNFILSSPFNAPFASSATAKEVYTLMSREDLLIKANILTELDIPAIAAYAAEAEAICNKADSDFKISPQTKQCIGRMVAAALEDFGYSSRLGRKARIPDKICRSAFKFGHVFYDDPEIKATKKIEKMVVSIKNS